MKRFIRRMTIRLRRLQRKPVVPPAMDETLHFCRHCGYAFTGRQCPMCGMPGGWTRFTGRKLFYGFLDIWGMGNRPMFRSMGHLLWRPGYMIRDYLGGHYLSYFPPFKMLAVTVVLVALVIWGFGIDTTNDMHLGGELLNALEGKASPAAIGLFTRINAFLSGNTLYRMLLQILMLVTTVWIIFRKRGLNFVETFFAMVYISCQMQIVTILWLILTQQFQPAGIIPYCLPSLLIFVLLILDFRQLYGLRLWGAIWRTLCTYLLLAVFYAIFLTLVIAVMVLSAKI